MHASIAATLIATLSATMVLATLSSCSNTDSVSAATKAPISASGTVSSTSRTRPDRSYWTQRTDAEVDLALDQLCATAKGNGKPALITFSAAWCQDCQIMRKLEKEPVLSDEMSHWNRLLIEPGHLDRHVPLLQAFGVGRIAWWVAARPQDCRLPAPAWQRLAEGPFEPSGGKVTAQGLADWLRAARER
jgi:hypothetical protein